MRNIVIGCDNAGVALKNIVIDFLHKKGVSVEDVGCSSESDQTLYPTIAQTVCNKVIESGYQDRGILICGTGIGMCMAANKCRGIRAAVCHDNYSAERSILSNNGNVLCLGARIIGPELAKKWSANGSALNLWTVPPRSRLRISCGSSRKISRADVCRAVRVRKTPKHTYVRACRGNGRPVLHQTGKCAAKPA